MTCCSSEIKQVPHINPSVCKYVPFMSVKLNGQPDCRSGWTRTIEALLKRSIYKKRFPICGKNATQASWKNLLFFHGKAYCPANLHTVPFLMQRDRIYLLSQKNLLK